jgi:exodeoxyribonuclease VII small subunit
MSMSKSKISEQKPAFETAIAEMERIVAQMEGGQLSLEDSLAAYRRGVTLLKACQDQLNDAETELRQFDGETLKPFDLPAERNG